MKLAQACETANDLLYKKGLAKHFTKSIICGSIRRNKENINDIDIVAIPKKESEYQFGEENLSGFIQRIDPEGPKNRGAKRFLDGLAIKRFLYNGIAVDLYLADQNTFETLVLIRTGSKEFNVRLTTLARGKGLKLFASGKGLCKIDKDDNILEVVEDKERRILLNLLGKVPKPEERNF